MILFRFNTAIFPKVFQNTINRIWCYRIADLESERDRMVQVVRWYMASYHAGRKSTVAKKPYNPVLGEVFKCYWDVPNLQSSSQPEVTDGPVPWCHRDQLTFVAEQVSHHPPSESSLNVT